MTTSNHLHPRASAPWWRIVNISPAERAGRIVLGAAAIVAGIVLLASAGSAWAVVLELLLIAAGADLLITGATGHCPLYAKLGHIPRSLRSPR
jgi:predicted phage tail protein